METPLSLGLDIALAPERTDEGSPEERAAFGLFTIRTQYGSLTEGFDFFLNGYRPGPLVSGYHAAEWFAWNWWRLRWEPRSTGAQWPLAHHMPSIGEGYVWPNLTIFSDGERTALVSHPSTRPDAKPFRYVGAISLVASSAVFEAALDAFIPQIIGRLRGQGVPETNLDRLWQDVLDERADPAMTERRRLEALLGRDAGTANDDEIDGLLADAVRLGDSAAGELAAGAARGGRILRAAEFEQLARQAGHDANTRDAASLARPLPTRPVGEVPAWRLGADAARALRAQEGLGTAPIPTTRLAALAGTSEAVITRQGSTRLPMSFALDTDAPTSRLVLRSKWGTGRRFDLARLIGDRLIAASGALHPATGAETYRQKAQRAFAAELLCPFDAVDAMLEGDTSQERQQDVADHFDVSPMAVETLLNFHGRLDREAFSEGLDIAGRDAT